MDNMDSRVNLVDYKPLSLPGSFFIHFISMASLGAFLMLSISALIIQEESLFNDLGPVILIALAVGYLFYS